MLLEFGLATIVALVTFSIADRLTQAGVLSIWGGYVYVVLTVFPQ